MPEVHRRVVLKPPGLSADDAARLRERLAAAVEMQRRLARSSPHVLQLVGDLQEIEEAFWVEHEPASPIEVNALYDPQASLADEKTLIRGAAALGDALRAAHTPAHGNPTVHGGLCGGTLLTTPDGIHKVADFGFAPAVCAVLGVESYVELAVAPRAGTAESTRGTGVWEVLSPEDYARDERICAFIDPEKYGSGMLASFEAGSDIIAAGILLHLMAEHRHPMLEPGDHRSVLTAESMSWTPYNGARRKALRDSSDPAVKRWCSLTASMLERLPQDRPSAGDIIASLSEVGVRPVDAAETLRRRLEKAANLVTSGQHADALNLLSDILATPDIPPELADRGYALRDECRSYDLVRQTRERLTADAWETAQEPLDALSAMSSLPATVAEQADKLAAELRRNLGIRDELDRIEAALSESARTDPIEALSVVRGLKERVEKPAADKTLVSPLRARCERLHEELRSRCDELQAAARAVEADHAVVNEWFTKLKDAWGREQWADFETLLRARPTTPHWPQSVKTDAQELQDEYEKVKEAHASVQRAGEALEAGNLDEAAELLAATPAITRCPTGLRGRRERVEERLREAKAEADEHARAWAWIKTVEQAMEATDWSGAASRLAARPALRHWPPEVLERERRHRPVVDARIKEAERRRLEIEEANRRAAAWLQSADEAAAVKDWERAINILTTPPLDAGRLPDDARVQAVRRKTEYEQRLEEHRRRQLEERTASVRELAAAFVDDIVAKELAGLLHPTVVDTAVDNVRFSSPQTPVDGDARLNVRVRNLSPDTAERQTAYDVAFRLDSTPPRICDDPNAVRAAIAGDLRELVHETQKRRAVELITPLRQGLFPDVAAETAIDKPVGRTTATIDLCGANVADARVETELVWDHKALVWTYADADVLRRRALDVAEAAAHAPLLARVFERSPVLRNYRHALVMNLTAPSAAREAVPHAPLRLECGLAIQTPRNKERDHLITFPVTCPKVGTVVVDADLKPAEDSLQRWLAATQEAARATMERRLKAQVKAAPAKVKLKGATKRIRRPVDELLFELMPRRGRRLPMTARWNAETFDFELPEELQAQINEVLRASPAPSKPPRPTAERTRAPDAGKRMKRALAFASPVAVTGVIVVAVALWPEERPPKKPGPPKPAHPRVTADAGRKTNGGTETETKRELRTTDDAIDEVRGILRDSRYLAEYAESLVPMPEPRAETSDLEGERVTIQYLLPGLKEPRRSLVLSLDPDREALDPPDRQALLRDVAAVEDLLDNAPATAEQNLKGMLADALDARRTDDARVVDVEQVDVVFEPEITWAVDDDLTGWSARNAAFAVALRPIPAPDDTGGSPETEGVAGIELSDLAADLRVRGGEVRVDNVPDAMGRLATQLLTELTQRQIAMLDDITNQIEAEGDAWDASFEPPAEARNAAAVNVKVSGLVRRGLTATWNARTLAFEDTWKDGVARIAAAREALRVLNRNIKQQEDHWLRDAFPDDSGPGSYPSVFELSAPAEEQWMLALPAPWAPRGERRSERTSDRLPIPVALPPRWDGDALVGAVETMDAPEYWELITTYRDLSRNPAYLATARKLRALADALQAHADRNRVDKLISYLNSDPAPSLVVPRVQLEGDGHPELSGVWADPSDEGAATPALRLSVRVRFGLKPPRLLEPDERADVIGPLHEALDEALQTLTEDPTQSDTPQPCTLMLRLSEDGTGDGPAYEWSDLGNAAEEMSATVEKARHLERLLGVLPERYRLEQDFEVELDGDSVTGLDPGRAYSLLQRVWRIKNPSALRNLARNPPRDLASFSGRRQAALKRRASFRRKQVVPTVFAEYFCGPRSTYAIVWSVLPDDGKTIKQGPSLLRLGENRAFYEPDTAQPAADLGRRLLDPLFARVQEAFAKDFESTFAKSLGLALAPDQIMACWGRNLAGVPFSPQKCLLNPIDYATHADRVESFSSLEDLRSGVFKDWRGSYELATSLLSDPRTFVQPPPDDLRWALDELQKAIQRSQIAGD